ncbi:D-hexose-6-phosphate mutarotase [Rubritalea sp.]|uniref:D-hexose-6-phosphate mutarotase n=1 Tax=Rubritalea sp. TaxID=2109375 RepID=UPI003EF74603
MAPTLDPSHLLPSELWFEEIAPDYPVIRINNKLASATIALHGAHVIEYIPRDQAPVIFTSREAVFKETKAIRGGIPICWPWFNAHPSDSSMPSHGFARSQFWQLISTESTSGGTKVTLQFNTKELELWPHATQLTLTIFIGKELKLDLTTTNMSDSDITIGGALHTYLHVGDIKEITLSGLENVSYLDTVSQTQITKDTALSVTAETDNIYQQTEASVIIHDPLLKREITVHKSGSTSTVVWNPWIDKSATMGDLANDEYEQFICVEAANALKDVYLLKANQAHTLGTTISSSPLSLKC